MKKVLSLAIAAALVAPVAAMADATVYGKVRASVDLVDIDVDGDAFDTDEWQINDKTSRLGVKGSEDLGNGLKAIYKLEAQVRMLSEDDEDGTASSFFTGRNAFVGLAGDFGTGLIGRHDTPLKMSTGKLDYFSDTAADNNGGQIDNNAVGGYTENLHDVRLDGSLVYISPSFSGFTFAGAIAPGEKTDRSTAPATDTEANGLADIYSIAGMYSNAGLYLSAAYEAADGNVDTIGIDEADSTQWRVGGGWDAGMWKVAAVYEDWTIDSPVTGDDLADITTWVISGAVKLGPGMAKAKYFSYEDEGSVTGGTGSVNKVSDHDGWAIGYDYNLSKRTQASALWVSSTFDEQPVGEDDIDVSVLSFQLNHNF